MRKVIIKIQGGLGNQLFQYAYAKYICEKNNFNKIILDVSYYNKKQIRDLELKHYELMPNVEFMEKNDNFINILYILYRIWYKLTFKKTDFFIKLHCNQFWISGRRSSEHLISPDVKKLFLIGYYQDIGYVQEQCEELKKDLKLCNSLSSAYIKYIKLIESFDNPVAVSIRNGNDYRKSGWPMCSKEYYIKGILYILHKKEIDSILVFSDCLEQVKDEKWFDRFKKVLYVDGINPTESLSLMMRCKDFVISNSTFAWWGAYLANNKEKIIIAPSYFYKNEKLKGSPMEYENMCFFNNFDGNPE